MNRVPVYVLRCTAKLLNAMGLGPSDLKVDTEATKPWLEWYANLLLLHRRKCLLVTNAATLYSVFVPAVRKVDLQNIDSLFREQLEKSMAIIGIDRHDSERVLADLGRAVFAKTVDRSVLGSMTDLAIQIQYNMALRGELEELDTMALHRDLNSVPMGALGYSCAIDRWRQCIGEPAK